jgi:hypothetical protein
MQFTKNEFIKTSQVKSLIQEAMQNIVERMAARDKVITANKTWLR